MRKMELKVFGGDEIANGKRVRMILAATSQRGAFAALQSVGLPTTIRTIATYWVVSGSPKEREVALAAPGTVFAASSLDTDDFAPLPKREVAKVPQVPKIPTDPEEKKQYDRARRESSDARKLARGEVRITSWLPANAAAALTRLTGGDESRGAVRAALTLALTTCPAATGKPKA